MVTNQQHLIRESFRQTGLSMRLDGSEDDKLHFGDHEPLGPMIESADEMESGSDSETEPEPPLRPRREASDSEREDEESKRAEA